ncbi:glycosyltransferase [Lysinibacillus sp. NPDC098008]|uniref:glycosyltransferase n=1 Tax=Lysinibacillus sp. NPDC098008 TaxID=3364146 RepID=UPI00382A17FA
MRILHVINTLGSGGAEKMLVDIVREMKEQNVICEVAVLTRSQNFFGSELEKMDIPTYYNSGDSLYSLSNINFLKNIIKAGNYDCIHTHLFPSQLFVPIALTMINQNIPLITTEHSTYNRRRKIKAFHILDFWMYKKYEKIIAITVETKDTLVKYLPSTKKKVRIIENGIDISKYKNAKPIERKKIIEHIKENEKIILMVAAMREQKDHETLIRASKLLPANYHIVFVGDGERMEEVKKYAILHGRESIVFLGRRTDVPAIMKASDVFVLASKWEGFGLVVVEAAATGLPTIASNVDGLNGVTVTVGGQVFEPYNEYDLAEKIIEAIECEVKKYNVAPFTIQTTVRAYLRVYQEILKD